MKQNYKVGIGIAVFLVLLVVGIFAFSGNNKSPTGRVIQGDLQDLADFNICLAESGMVIYGLDSCPYCRDLVEILGGYSVVEPVYVDCMKEQQRCRNEMFQGGVPEIQINGEMYRGQRTLEAFSQATGCPIPTGGNN